MTYRIELNGGVVVEKVFGSPVSAWRYAVDTFADNLRAVEAVRWRMVA